MIRSTCVLVGMIALFLQGSSGGHMLLVEHSHCAEHGELVHGGESHSHVAAEHVQADTAAFDAAPEASSEEAHEHCSVSSDRRDAILAILEATASRPLDGKPDAFTPCERTPFAQTPSFRIAPKNSPPA